MDIVNHLFVLVIALATNAHSVTLLIKEIDKIFNKKRNKWEDDNEQH